MGYAVTLRELSADEGGGWLAEIPDLPGCAADGETQEEALSCAREAIDEWIDAAKEMGREVPQPNGIEKFSGKWVQRVPKSVHMKLTDTARREGVSINALVSALIAEGLGRKDSQAA